MKDLTKSAIFNIYGRPNFNGYRGTIYESEYQKFFMYNGGEKHFKENEDNKLILNMETKKLFINGVEIIDGTFGCHETNKPLQYGLMSWLDGFDVSATNEWISRTGKYNGKISIGDTDSTAGFRDDIFRTGENSHVRIIDLPFRAKGSYTVSIYIDSYESKGFAQNNVFCFGDFTLRAIHKYFCLELDGCLPPKVHLDMHAEDGVIVTFACNEGKLDVYCNGFKIYHEVDLSLLTRDWDFLQFSNSGSQGMLINFKSILVYDRYLGDKEVKHNYLYHRYYRDKDKAVNINVVPMIQELNGLDGFTKPDGYDEKTFTMSDDGTFYKGEMCGQIVDHKIYRKVSNPSLILNQENTGIDIFQITHHIINKTSFRLIGGPITTEYTNGYYRHFTRKYIGDITGSKVVATFNVRYMKGDWQYLSIGGEPNCEIKDGFNIFTLDVVGDEISRIGFMVQNLLNNPNSEIVIENYKCELITEINSHDKIYSTGFTGDNNTGFLIEEEYHTGVYKGVVIDNKINTLSPIGVEGRGVIVDRIELLDNGWYTGRIKYTDNVVHNGKYVVFGVNKPFIFNKGDNIYAHIDFLCSNPNIQLWLDGNSGIGIMDTRDNISYSKSAIAPILGKVYNVYLVFDKSQKENDGTYIYWRNPMVTNSKYAVPFNSLKPESKMNNVLTYSIQRVAETSNITETYNIYYEFYNPESYIDNDADKKLAQFDVSSKPNEPSGYITNHSTFQIPATALMPYYKYGRNIIWSYNGSLFINGYSIGRLVSIHLYEILKVIFLSHPSDTADAYLRCISTRCELYNASKITLTEEQCINISKYGLTINNKDGVLPKMREV